MQFGKLVNGGFKAFTGDYIRHNGRVYVNPTEIVQSYEYVEIPAEENEFNDGGIE